MIQQLTLKLSIELNAKLTLVDTDYGVASLQGQDAITLASTVEHYVDISLDLPKNNIMGSMNNQKLVTQLLIDAKNLLQNSYSEHEFEETLAIIKKAQLKGCLGADKPVDSSLSESVNIANDILRNRNFDEVEISSISRQPKALYVYVALVAVGLISA
jgi:hypothetical protein